jgi:hypothetical protein
VYEAPSSLTVTIDGGAKLALDSSSSFLAVNSRTSPLLAPVVEHAVNRRPSPKTFDLMAFLVFSGFAPWFATSAHPYQHLADLCAQTPRRSGRRPDQVKGFCRLAAARGRAFDVSGFRLR